MMKISKMKAKPTIAVPSAYAAKMKTDLLKAVLKCTWYAFRTANMKYRKIGNMIQI